MTSYESFALWTCLMLIVLLVLWGNRAANKVTEIQISLIEIQHLLRAVGQQTNRSDDYTRSEIQKLSLHVGSKSD
jgi:hypothetical protein